jgi:integrase
MPWLQKKSKKGGSSKTREKPNWYIHVPTGHGYKALSTGAKDKKVAQQIEVMVDNLYRGKRRDSDILAWLLDRSLPRAERLKPLTLLHYFDNNQLDELKAIRWPKETEASREEAPPNANDYVDTWLTAVRQRSSKDNADRFERAVRSFMPVGVIFDAKKFEYSPLFEWSAMLMEGEDNGGLGLSAGTATRHRAGLINFIDHLVSSDVIAKNYLATIRPPKPSKPRDRHLLTTDAIRLIHAFADKDNAALQHLTARHGLSLLELQAYNALLSGAGVEVSVALDLSAGDVRLDYKEVRAPGTKSYARDRVVRVADWAWPWVAALARTRLPSEKLFKTLPDRWIAADAFNSVVGKLAKKEPRIFGDYWMRDGRHTYAVRAVRAGTPPEVVATQLGHVDATLVNKVYGRYKPNSAERDHWERMATERDKAREGVMPRAKVASDAVPQASKAGRTSRAHAPKIDWPSKKELLRRLKARSTVALAEELDVSDQALRKHLKRHGVTQLPDGRRSGASRPRGSRATSKEL